MNATLFSPDSNSHIRGEVYYETDTYISVTDGNRQVGGPKRIVLPSVEERDGYHYATCACGWVGKAKTLRSAAVGEASYHGRP